MGRKFLSDIAERRREKRAERQGWRALTAEEAEHIRETAELPEGATDAFIPMRPSADWEPDEVNRKSAP
jgi:hypothetical protein